MATDDAGTPKNRPGERPDVDAAYEAVVASDLPPTDFNISVLSLHTSALIHRGDAPDAGGTGSVDMPMARQTIDMLAILEEKSRGNLNGEEERLIHQVLFDLRMRFTKKASGG